MGQSHYIVLFISCCDIHCSHDIMGYWAKSEKNVFHSQATTVTLFEIQS